MIPESDDLISDASIVGGRLAVDEAFVRYCPEHSVACLVPERPALVVLGSLTKALAIPGARLGFLAAHPSALAALSEGLPPWRLNCLADAVAAQVVLMHSRGILHGDLNLSNFLCTEQDGHFHFSMIDINRSHFCEGFPTDEACLHNLVRMTHRRDLYEYLIRSYARQRQWDEDATAGKALLLLDHFENRKVRF